MALITFDDKVDLTDRPEIADINKIVADDMNEIKSSMNYIGRAETYASIDVGSAPEDVGFDLQEGQAKYIINNRDDQEPGICQYNLPLISPGHDGTDPTKCELGTSFKFHMANPEQIGINATKYDASCRIIIPGGSTADFITGTTHGGYIELIAISTDAGYRWIATIKQGTWS